MDNPNYIKESILKCLQYYGLFKHPLTPEEILQYLNIASTQREVDSYLNDLENDGLVHHFAGYYTIINEPKWVVRRKEGHNRAINLLSKAPYYVSIVASFPFVKGIAISGSLSKLYSGENGDVDYFIITEENKLWIARTFLHLFKKLTFLSGHQHYFCMNYFVDMQALMIENRNLYTAIEIETMLPVYNEALINDLKIQNSWTKEFLPNYQSDLKSEYLTRVRFPLLKKTLQFILSLLLPTSLNIFLMKLTKWKWRRKWKNHPYSPEEYEQAFLSTPNVSKNHPANYEKKVLQVLQSPVYYRQAIDE